MPFRTNETRIEKSQPLLKAYVLEEDVGTRTLMTALTGFGTRRIASIPIAKHLLHLYANG